MTRRVEGRDAMARSLIDSAGGKGVLHPAMQRTALPESRRPAQTLRPLAPHTHLARRGVRLSFLRAELRRVLGQADCDGPLHPKPLARAPTCS
eukprot:CAMPEP_0183339310 /NCGR_PEP_ID=MMETSP0164_2-20130417/6281_1 /TAXON_ID=221442 /ORGANISM="Coccolithus pelagicus ssp braarudi, Strain PLY182g" /LENGTH=92 /DNA_ID=CAMNT_0025509279 /DNA_START=213 /DNA_END=493 /DNA_ORIENTATION=+